MSQTNVAPDGLVSYAEYDALAQQLVKAQQDLANLQIHLLWLKKQVFGRKSERLDLNQLGLFDSEELPGSIGFSTSAPILS